MRSRPLPRPALAALLCALGTAAPAGAQAPGELYVALGDSYTAGPLVPNQHGTPIDCARSDQNYPSRVAAALRLRLRDVSCSSATTRHMAAPQGGLPLGGTNPPQFDGVTPDARLVSVGIGGNDAGLVGVATTCAQLGLTAPAGTACRDHHTTGGVDRVKARIDAAAPKVAAVLQGLHARAPRARVALVGYPAAAPTDGRGCYPMVPMSPDDLAYVNELLIGINAMMAQQAAANDAEFVDTFTASVGHDVCALPPTRWFEGVVPTAPAFPLHPNAEGEASMARSALAVLGRPAPARPAAPAARATPRLTALRVRRHAVRTGPPARIDFRLDRAARVRITLARSVRGRVGRAQATLVHRGRAGVNHVLIPRRAIGRTPGRYRLTATPAGGAAVTATLRLRARR